MTALHQKNLLFQSEKHPLVAAQPRNLEEHCLSLIHEKAYEEAALMAQDMVVLDVGCNTGYGTACLARKAVRAVGVDVSPVSVAAAAARFSGSNLEFQHTDGTGLPFEACAFDRVFSFQVIEHVVDCDNYLAELQRVLKTEGLAVFTTPNRQIRLDPDMEPWNPFHVREFSAGELHAVLAPHFAHVEIWGLFATPALYGVELRRVERARTIARNKLRSRVKRILQSSLPMGVSDRLASFVRGVKGRAVVAAGDGREDSSGKNVARYPFLTRDLFYKRDDLDAALDLMALCSAERGCLDALAPVRTYPRPSERANT